MRRICPGKSALSPSGEAHSARQGSQPVTSLLVLRYNNATGAIKKYRKETICAAKWDLSEAFCYGCMPILQLRIMVKRILILGASGTVGHAVSDLLSCEKNLKTIGTYFSARQENALSLIRFSVEFPNDINSILKQVRPDIVISSLRGDFDKQLITHENIANYLMANSGRLIYLSTANVFDGSWDRPHYEDDAQISNSDYGQFKIRCEALLRSRMGDQSKRIRVGFFTLGLRT